MKISFDIDDTLVLHQSESPIEPVMVPWLFRLFFRERVRLGTSELFHRLQEAGHELLVYTTSFRGPMHVKWWLRFYGARIRKVINETHHQKWVVPRYRGESWPSKHPGLFGIDLHIDDSLGVHAEGRRNGFRTLVVEPTDRDWVAKILDGVRYLEENVDR